MTFTWITSRHPPDSGGMACSSERLTNSLRNREHEVFVIHLTQHPERTVGKQETGRSVFEHWHTVLTTGINGPLEPERLFWTCREQMMDSVLIGFGGEQPGYLAALWGKWLHLKSVVLFRGNDFERTIHDMKRAWMTHFVLEHADLVGAVSQEMTARIRTLRSGPTLYTPNSIDTAAWTFFESDMKQAHAWRAQCFPDNKPVIGMIGQLKSKKGLDLALTLLNSSEYRDQTHLLTVGDIPAQIKHDHPMADSDNWKRVPFQRRERLPMFYAVVDIVFIPSIYDGMPNVLLEAMSLGKVVVASRTGGIPDLIADGENGFLCDIGNVSSVMNAVDTALALTQEDRQRIGACARKTIEQHFTPEQEIERLEAALSQRN